MTRLLLVAAMLIPTVASAAPQMRVEGTRIVVTDDHGNEVDGAALEGAELDLGALGSLRIEHMALDPDARFPDELWLMDAQLRAPGAPAYANACATDAATDARMVIYSGYLDPSLRYLADGSRFSLSCVSGVEAKCLRWGYLPWRNAPIGGEPLAPYFETCIRLARADYCGDDQPTTRNGTAIDIEDRVGIQSRTPNLPEFDFEAGWGPHGALCVHHARVPENLALEDLRDRCPRLATATLGERCDVDRALALGALILNRSIIRTPRGEAAGETGTSGTQPASSRPAAAGAQAPEPPSTSAGDT
jgi:hypothetical protein